MSSSRGAKNHKVEDEDRGDSGSAMAQKEAAAGENPEDEAPGPVLKLRDRSFKAPRSIHGTRNSSLVFQSEVVLSGTC